jgi:hypothetical protein
MSIFTPGRRWQAPFMPFKRTTFKQRALAKIELAVKSPLFGCRMCGNCLLQETAFICPMECPKGLRNGPCGGSTPEKCYVDESRPCAWFKIYERSFKLGREALLLEVLPPMDWDKAGMDAWGDVFSQAKKAGIADIAAQISQRGSDPVFKVLDTAVFRPVRQPEWWQGDAEYHAPKYSQPVSNLERALKNGEFVVAAEVTPPISVNTDKLKKNIELLKPYVTAINFKPIRDPAHVILGVLQTCAGDELRTRDADRGAGQDSRRAAIRSDGCTCLGSPQYPMSHWRQYGALPRPARAHGYCGYRFCSNVMDPASNAR